MPFCKRLETWQILGNAWQRSVNHLDTFYALGDFAVSYRNSSEFTGEECKENLHWLGDSKRVYRFPPVGEVIECVADRRAFVCGRSRSEAKLSGSEGLAEVAREPIRWDF